MISKFKCCLFSLKEKKEKKSNLELWYEQILEEQPQLFW